ncbi:hypothetical protein A2701_02540 [Candidatus Amesbacteria bacterium RIFCSPHIGHO2_01_FULL_47_34]|nr:MAG: hypothetical protein A2701_02540 [Candidatus Amesbacteria bacterium RIFCSPHIGHO2_01_FULL_47_34]
MPSPDTVPLVTPLESDQPDSTPSKVLLFFAALLVVVGGIFSGYKLSRRGVSASGNPATAGEMVNTATEVGSKDTKTFRDSAKGTLEKGGINGEGTHHITREENPAHPVYLVSSIVDLDEFVGKNIEVWGETIKGQKAGWLMDVGRVIILN